MVICTRFLTFCEVNYDIFVKKINKKSFQTTVSHAEHPEGQNFAQLYNVVAFPTKLKAHRNIKVYKTSCFRFNPPLFRDLRLVEVIKGFSSVSTSAALECPISVISGEVSSSDSFKSLFVLLGWSPVSEFDKPFMPFAPSVSSVWPFVSFCWLEGKI